MRRLISILMIARLIQRLVNGSRSSRPRTTNPRQARPGGDATQASRPEKPPIDSTATEATPESRRESEQ